jgi:hypothetical protein
LHGAMLAATDVLTPASHRVVVEHGDDLAE